MEFLEVLMLFILTYVFLICASTMILMECGYGWATMKGTYICISWVTVFSFMAYLALIK